MDVSVGTSADWAGWIVKVILGEGACYSSSDGNG